MYNDPEGFDYDYPLWRPPSEGDNLIIQATLGCSWNRCRFCSMYRSKRFQARPLEQVFADIDSWGQSWPDARRVFLADGDAMCLPTDHLLAILGKLAATFPGLNRVSCYALPANLLRKSVEELAALKSAKLSLVYVGIESGSPEILKRIAKGVTQRQMIEALGKPGLSGIKVSATVVLGVGGSALWQEHIDGTVEVVNAAPPEFLSTLQLGVAPEVTQDFAKAYPDGFEFQDDLGMLAEQERLIEGLNPPRPIIFRSNHASNALALAGNLPKDKKKLLAVLAQAQEGLRPLRARFMRGL
ncbi:Radical SAM domain protein [Rhodospirillaceae bacterium LM-1]|nr:Radical SAM domain protein [Rhodospirillaceae bacterium LM-1]